MYRLCYFFNTLCALLKNRRCRLLHRTKDRNFSPVKNAASGVFGCRVSQPPYPLFKPANVPFFILNWEWLKQAFLNIWLSYSYFHAFFRVVTTFQLIVVVYKIFTFAGNGKNSAGKKARFYAGCRKVQDFFLYCWLYYFQLIVIINK